jgi:nitrogen fixation/metabolism regulation signal transduction histidine kinase
MGVSVSKDKTGDLRKKLLIEPALQKKIIMKFVLLGVGITAVNMIGFYLLVARLIDQVGSLNQANTAVLEIIQQTCLYLIVSSIFLSGCVLVGFCIYGLYFSNRIAGPIYNLRKVIARVLAGEQDVRVQFRQNDYFQELSEEINQLLEKKLKTSKD